MRVSLRRLFSDLQRFAGLRWATRTSNPVVYDQWTGSQRGLSQIWRLRATGSLIGVSSALWGSLVLPRPAYAHTSTSLEQGSRAVAPADKESSAGGSETGVVQPENRLPGSLAELRSARIVLYQYETCPFCNKLRAYLDYWRIPYEVVEVNPIGKKELAFSSYRKVPVLVVNGTQLNDSGETIKQLERITEPERNLNTQWFDWIDSWFVHTLPPNIYRTRREALETFDYIAEKENFSPWQRLTIRYFGAAAMYVVSRRLKKKYDIVNERQALYEACRDWLTAVGWPRRRFLGGARPCAADIAMFGVLRSIEGFTAFRELAAHVPEMVDWYEAMKEQVGPSARIEATRSKSS